jgi:hypothetical protein
MVKIGDTLVLCLIEGTLTRKNLGKVQQVGIKLSEDQFFGKRV